MGFADELSARPRASRPVTGDPAEAGEFCRRGADPRGVGGCTSAGPRDVPIGAVVVAADGTELARAANAREELGDPTAHAEILALRAAARRLGDGWRLEGATLAVTVEPCTMCAGALVMARVARVVFGAWEPKTGAVGSLWDVVRDRRLTHRPQVRGGVLADSVRPRWRSSSHASVERSALRRVCAQGGFPRRFPVLTAHSAAIWCRPCPSVSCHTVACPSGLRSTPRKRVTGNPRPRVQIPPPPP